MIDILQKHIAHYPKMQIQDVTKLLYQSESYTQVYEVIQKIEQGMLASTKRPFVVAIDGMSGSGKSTLGQLLQQNYPESNLFHMDDYFLQPHQRTTERLTEPGGNVDYERFKEEIILHLSDTRGLNYHVYDCSTQKLGPKMYVPWKPLVIIEGTYSQHPYFGDAYDLRLFCSVSKEEQRNRILNRNGAEMLKRFENEWIPKETLYFERFELKDRADVQLQSNLP